MLKCLGDGLGDHGETSKKCPAGRRRGEFVVFGVRQERTYLALRAQMRGVFDRYDKKTPRTGRKRTGGTLKTLLPICSR